MATMSTAAEFIRTHEKQIFERWFDEASQVAAARGLDRPEFTNVMPSYIASLAHAQSDLGAFAGDRRKFVESHVASRLRLGFQVEEVVDEFLLVGTCTRRLWEAARPEDRPRPDDAERLWTELHRAAAAVTASFAKHMAEDEQIEKRYRRRLQMLATETLQPGAMPLRSRLKDVIDVIMEAMQASSAALFLYHSKTGKLVSAATAGLGEMDGFAASSDVSSFAGWVASSTEPSAIDDVPLTRLTLPESLRKSGIQSLLGVRLPPHRALLGVLYVGIAQARDFTARESGCLEVLGEQLALHLENAALFSELTASVAALHSEREMRERFVSVLAHDLRGPLSAAKMAAHLIMDGAERDEERKLALRIDRNIDRTDTMVRDLLDANRIHAGERISLHLAECDLGLIARDVVDEMIVVHGARFRLETDSGVHGFWSAEELRRAIWNLVMNAVKYGAEGRPISIKVERLPDVAAISVHNEGVAIPAHEQADIFRPYSRTHAAKATSQRGWGLGLSLVQGCAEAHGGEVVVRSDSDRGTTFVLRIPWDARPFQPIP